MRHIPHSPEGPSSRHRILIVGGPDVDARIPLMQALAPVFRLAAAGSNPQLRPQFAGSGLEYFTYPLCRGVNPLQHLQTAYRLYRLTSQLRPDMVHTFDTVPCVWGRIAARLAGVPVIIGTLPGLGALYANDRVATRFLRFPYQLLQKLACHISDLTILQNGDNVLRLVEMGLVPADKIALLPGSGVQTNVFDPAAIPADERRRVRRELGVSPEAILVTMVSRLLRSKGVLDLSEAARIVRQHTPACSFLLVGPDDDECLDRLRPWELSQVRLSVTWAGMRRDVPAILAASDIFVFPSSYGEGIPRVLLEAASMALPIVTTDSPGCRVVVRDDANGLFVPANDPPALADAVLQLANYPDLRSGLGEESRRRAVLRFDFDQIAEETRCLYQVLLARKVGESESPLE